MRDLETFDLCELDEKLIEEIVFVDIFYPGMAGPGEVTFFAKNGDEYLIGVGEEFKNIWNILELFPEIYDVYSNLIIIKKDEYGYRHKGCWRAMPKFAGVFMVRDDYFDDFYRLYRQESETQQDFPISIARKIFGKGKAAQDDVKIYIKTKERWEREEREWMANEKEREENRLTEKEVPWMKCKVGIFDGYIRLFARKNGDGSISAYRWIIKEQKEQLDEESYKKDGLTECYNLFLQKYEDKERGIFDNSEAMYKNCIKPCEIGKFVRSYKELDKAMRAVEKRNEWIGWGNVDKKNIHMLNYEELRMRIENDTELWYM